MGIRFLSDAGRIARRADAGRRRDPAGVRRHRRACSQQLDRRGCTLVDTTCGSVLNVWKNVRRYAEDGFTSVIHGKVLARGDAGHGVAGRAATAASTSSSSIAPKPQRSATTSAHGGDRAAFLTAFEHGRLAGLRSRPRSAAHRLRQPDDDADVRVARDRRDVPRGDARPVRRRPSCRALPRLRHDLQRDAGSPGRRRRAARRASRST